MIFTVHEQEGKFHLKNIEAHDADEIKKSILQSRFPVTHVDVLILFQQSTSVDFYFMSQQYV